jgi:hypothetical protein
MRWIAYFLLASLVLVPFSGARAQDAAADITVVSVLTMAKEEAKKAPDEEARIDLRFSVALSMMRTGETASFGAYALDARNAIRHREAVKAEHHETAKHNLETEGRAKQAFLAGEIEQARELLRQCRPLWLSARCPHPSTLGPYLTALFLMWEVEAGRSAAAWQRLTTADWPPGMQARFLVNLGPSVAGGDRQRLLVLRQLAEIAGANFDSCIMMEPQLPATLGGGAKLRKLACDGHVTAALDIARVQRGSSLRTRTLLIIAEGMMGVPGLSGDPLYGLSSP